jgi:8-oxo-dGTP pyrophosphatase MutT (NUDIX family)
LYPREDALYTVFIKRPEYEGYHSGQISLPGGKFQTEDIDLKQTALREAFEETGIIPEGVTILSALTELFIPPSNFILTPFIGYQMDRPRFIPDAREVAEVIEADIRDFNPNNFHIKDIILHNGRVVKTPYYDIRGHVIWGATGMIMREVEELFRDEKQ